MSEYKSPFSVDYRKPIFLDLRDPKNIQKTISRSGVEVESVSTSNTNTLSKKPFQFYTPIPTYVRVIPSNAQIYTTNETAQFSIQILDQHRYLLNIDLNAFTIDWSTQFGTGSIDQNGLYTGIGPSNIAQIYATFDPTGYNIESENYGEVNWVDSFNVTYDGNGSDSGSVPVDSNTYPANYPTIVLSPGTLAKAGYEFLCWSHSSSSLLNTLVPGDTITGNYNNLTLYAIWSIGGQTDFTVTYDTQGGTSVSNDTYSLFDPSVFLPDAQKTGQALLGWYTDPTGGFKVGNHFEYYTPTYPFGNITLYAQWATGYQITYDANGADSGTVPVDTTYYNSGEYVLTADPGTLEKTGYTFDNWNTSADGTGSAYYPQISWSGIYMNSDVTLYAIWSQPQYSITYFGNDNNSGTPPVDSNYYSPNEQATILDQNDMLKTGYIFKNWNTTSWGSGINLYPADLYNVTNSISLYALWIIDETYTVTYDIGNSDGGTPPVDTNTYQQYDHVTLPDNGTLYKDGYTFQGWRTDIYPYGESYHGLAYFIMPGNNVTLYANWAQDLSVVYDGNGNDFGSIPVDTNIYPLEQDFYITVLEPGALAKVGYIFKGWNKYSILPSNFSDYYFVDAGSTQLIYSTLNPLTLYAIWMLDQTYSVTYDANGADGGTVPVDTNLYYAYDFFNVESNIDLYKTGYYFQGWTIPGGPYGDSWLTFDSLPNTWMLDDYFITSGLTLYAKWIPSFLYKTVYSLDIEDGFLPSYDPGDGWASDTIYEYNWDGDYPIKSYSTLYSHGGTKSMKVEWPSSGYPSVIIDMQRLPRVPFTVDSITISAWVYVPSGNPDVMITTSDGQYGETETIPFYSLSTSTSVKDTWTELTLTVPISNFQYYSENINTDDRFNIEPVHLGDLTGVVYIDDITITPNEA